MTFPVSFQAGLFCCPRLLFQIILYLAQLIRCVTDMSHTAVTNLSLRNGQDMMTNAVPGVSILSVGGILPPGDSPFGQIAFNLGALHTQQGTNDSVPYRLNTGKPPDIASPEEMEQTGFRTVVGIMGHCNQSLFPCLSGKGFIP